jgi:hypothetical protein
MKEIMKDDRENPDRFERAGVAEIKRARLGGLRHGWDSSWGLSGAL